MRSLPPEDSAVRVSWVKPAQAAGTTAISPDIPDITLEMASPEGSLEAARHDHGAFTPNTGVNDP
jgi:hypothetical protein